MSDKAGGDKTTPSNDKMIFLLCPQFSPVTLVLVMWATLHAQVSKTCTKIKARRASLPCQLRLTLGVLLPINIQAVITTLI